MSAILRIRRRPIVTLASAVAATAVAFGSAATSPVAVAEPNNGGGVFDVERFDDCLKKYNPGQAGSLEEMDARIKWCCEDAGGVWTGDKQGCVAPSGNSVGTRQIPGDIATATLTPAPLRPIPGDMPAVTPAPPA